MIWCVIHFYTYYLVIITFIDHLNIFHLIYELQKFVLKFFRCKLFALIGCRLSVKVLIALRSGIPDMDMRLRCR